MQNEEFYRRCRYLVDRCDPTRLHYLQLLVEHKQRRQCSVEQLPGNLYERILSHLEVPTLVNLSQCDRFWNNLLGKGESSEAFWEFYSTHVYKAIGGPCNELGADRYRGEVEVANNWRALRCKSIIVEVDGSSGDKVVTCMEMANSRVYAGCDDGTVRVHCAVTGDQKMLLSGHRGGVWCLKVHGEVLITGSTDRTLSVWCASSGRKRGDLLGHSSTVRCVDVYENYVVSGSRDGTLRIWDWTSLSGIAMLSGHTDSVRAVKLVPVGTDLWVVSGSYDATVRVWSVKRAEIVHVLRGHTGRVYTLAVINGFVYSAGQDGQVIQWNLHSGELVKKFDDAGSGLIGMLSWNEDVNVVTAGCINGTLAVFEPASPISLLLASAGPSITALTMNRRFVVTGSEAGVKIYEWRRQRYWGMPLERADNLWQLACSENILVAAYQLNGVIKLAFFNFSAIQNAAASSSMEIEMGGDEEEDKS